MWQDSWIYFWTLTSLFCSMSRVAGWRLLKILLSTQACSTYAYLKMFQRKLEKHLWRDLFYESCGITDHSLLKVKFNTVTLLEIWRRICIDLHFKLSQLNYTNDEKQKQKKEHIRLVRTHRLLSIGVNVVAKTDDKICLKYYQHLELLFICFLCCDKEGRVVKNVENDVATLKSLPPCKNRR